MQKLQISGVIMKNRFADKILVPKAANLQINTSGFERQIVNLVCRLYNLIWEEVGLIDPRFITGKVEHEGITIFDGEKTNDTRHTFYKSRHP
jgi:hypothetical protein